MAMDQQAMMALARAFPTDHLHVVDLPYRLSSWAVDDPDNVGLWVDAEGRLRAWAVLQTPFWTVDYICPPDADGSLHREILAWADRRARLALDTANGRPSWYVTAFPGQAGRIRDLEAAGFVCQAHAGEDAWSKVFMGRPAHIPVAPGVLPAGFTLRPLQGEDEVEAYVGLHRGVFGSDNMTPEWRRRTLRRREYRPELDLVAVAPGGRLAAFCVGWLDPRGVGGPRGQIEPLGVHKEFRSLGLGRAILSEGLRRLALCGAETVYVETDVHRDAAVGLYEAVGFRAIQDVWMYRKDYGGGQ